jgi:phage regulator Rha-like protein
MQLPTIENLTMTSREIADLVEKQHAHVMRDIRKMADDLGESNFGLATYTDKQGKEQLIEVLSEVLL